jgi:hypothetical protein
MPMHIFRLVVKCSYILFYFILWVGAVQSSNLFWIQTYLKTIKLLKFRRALLCFWPKTSAGPAFFFSLSAWPSTDSPGVSLLPPFLRGPMAQHAFPMRSPGSLAIAHPNQRRLLRRVMTEAARVDMSWTLLPARQDWMVPLNSSDLCEFWNISKSKTLELELLPPHCFTASRAELTRREAPSGTDAILRREAEAGGTPRRTQQRSPVHVIIDGQD